MLPWGWIIGSGIYANDTAAQVRPTMMRLFDTAIVAAILLGIRATLIERGVARPVDILSRAMEGLVSGDLHQAVPAPQRADELGRMIGAVQIFKDNQIHTRALEAETAQARLGAEVQRRAGMCQMADAFEVSVAARGDERPHEHAVVPLHADLAVGSGRLGPPASGAAGATS